MGQKVHKVRQGELGLHGIQPRTIRCESEKWEGVYGMAMDANASDAVF